MKLAVCKALTGALVAAAALSALPAHAEDRDATGQDRPVAANPGPAIQPQPLGRPALWRYPREEAPRPQPYRDYVFLHILGQEPPGLTRTPPRLR